MYFVYNPDCTQLLRRRKSCKGLNGTQWCLSSAHSSEPSPTFLLVFLDGVDFECSRLELGFFVLYKRLSSEYRGVYIFGKTKKQKVCRKPRGWEPPRFSNESHCVLFSCWMELDWAQHCLNLFRICLGLLGVAQQIFHFGWNHWLPLISISFLWFLSISLERLYTRT